MSNGLVAGIVGAAIAGGIAFFFWGRPLNDLRVSVNGLQNQAQSSAAALSKAEATIAALDSTKKRATTIVLKKHPTEANKCAADVEHNTVEGEQGKKVAWIIDIDTKNPCNPGPFFDIELVFEPVDGVVPFANAKIELGQDARAHRIKMTGKSDKVKYPYSVWFDPPTGPSYKMVDPDLEVEPPQMITTKQ